jgi:lipopolysaccharide exporter
VIIFSTVLAILVSATMLTVQTFSECWQLFLRSVRFERMWAALKRYSNFPRYSTASAVLSNLGWQVPTFMLSGYFSSTVVGQYALGNKVLRIPVNLVGTNIATVFFQHASEVHHQGTLRTSVERMFRYLITIFLFPSLMLCLIGKDLFMVTFGNRWGEAGVYTQILSIYVLFWFMAVPLGIALNVLEKQALELRLVIMLLVTRVIALWIGGTLASARLALALFSIVGVLVYGYFCFVVLRLCAVPILQMVRYMATNAAGFIPAALVIAVLKHLAVAPMVTITTSGILLLGYYAYVIRTDSIGREVMASMLRKFIPAAAS